MDMIKVDKTKGGRNVVSARDLHAFLESGQQFGNWIRNRIEKYGFVENEDFKVFNNGIKNPRGGRPMVEYALTLDMAKELSMVEGNEKGRQARRYFSEWENRSKNTDNQVVVAKTADTVLTMTSLEIAEITGKQHGNVMRDIRNMMEALSMDSDLNPYCVSTSYKGKDGRDYDQYELDRDTCLTLLLGYDPVARMKVVRRWQELEAAQGAFLPRIRDPQKLALVQALVELDRVQQEQERLAREQERQSQEMAKLAENVAVIGARTQPENCHYTVMGWAKRHGRDLPLNEAAKLGRMCANLSRERGLPMGDVSDPRFGRVNSYHESVLEDTFSEAAMCGLAV